MAEPKKVSAPLGMAVAGSEIVGFALAGVGIDYAVGSIHTVPWATLILAPLGTTVALWHLFTMVRQRGSQS